MVTLNVKAFAGEGSGDTGCNAFLIAVIVALQRFVTHRIGIVLTEIKIGGDDTVRDLACICGH